MDEIDDFLKHYQQRLLLYLDATEKRSPYEQGPLEFVDEVLDAWARFTEKRQLVKASPHERTFWFSLYQLEELVENSVVGQLDPYEGLLMQKLAMARDLLREWKELPEGFYATRPGE